MIELLTDELSLERCVEAVRSAGSGGIVTFIGSVRDFSDGEQIERLEYEAYEEMAKVKIQQVVDETRSRWPVKSMAVQHRLGVLEVGEDAVIIAVACPHRAEAFEACRYAIDRLKEIVPIWKKEFGTGGEVWVGGPTMAESPSSRDPVPG